MQAPLLPPRCVLAATLLAAAAAHAAPPADATSSVYKCQGDDGRPVYQENACPAGRELRNFATDPADVSVIPFDAAAPAAEPRRAAGRPRSTTATARGDRGRPTPKTGDAGERRHLREGMTEVEVMARLGQPDVTSGRSGKGLRWSWLPAAGDPQTITTVRFEDGRVVSIDRKVVR